MSESQVTEYKYELDDILELFGIDFELDDINIDNLDFDELITKYNIVISSTTSNTVTFKFVMPLEEIGYSGTTDVYITWDVNNNFSNVSFKYSTSSSTVNFKLSLSFGDYTIDELSEEEKDNFILNEIGSFL